MSCRDAPRADSDTHGRLQPTPSEGRQRWHYDTLSSPQPPPPALFLRDDCGPPGLLGMGTAAASAGAAGPSQGLRAGWSSGRTEAGVHRGERTTHLRERADDRDSEPDYLLRPTRHGPGGLLTVNVSGSFYHWSIHRIWGHRYSNHLIGTDLSSKVQLRFESLIKGTVAQVTDLRHYPHSVCDILVLFSRRGGSLKGQRRLGRVTTVESKVRTLLRPNRFSSA